MTTFETIKMLAKNRDVSIKDLSKKLGFGESTIYKWKTQTPKLEHLKKVADYFNVPLDFLTDSDDSKSIDLEDALKNVMSYDGQPMTDNDREAILAFMRGRISSK